MIHWGDLALSHAKKVYDLALSTDQDYGQDSYPGLTELRNGKIRVWCIFIHWIPLSNDYPQESPMTYQNSLIFSLGMSLLVQTSPFLPGYYL